MIKPLKPEQYAALLEAYVAHLDGELAAISPSGWPVASLKDSYLGAEVSKHLEQVHQSAMIDLALAIHQQEIAAAYAEKKISHHYV